jgi:release factor glutamine methyltransferase
MKQQAVRQYMIEALEGFEERERNNVISYYIDAKQAEILSNTLASQQLAADVSALNKGEPVQYVTGISFFYGHRFCIRPGCLIPRPETEELVHWIIEDSRRLDALKILDIGVGSGCILLSVVSALENRGIDVGGFGLDISPAAIEVFNENKKRIGVGAQAIIGDIRSDLDLPMVNVIVSNPPYILDEEKARMDASVLTYEPPEALFVEGSDPLVYYKRVMELGKTFLLPGGVIYFETSDLYHTELSEAIDEQTYYPEFRKDLNGSWRMLKLTKHQLS